MLRTDCYSETTERNFKTIYFFKDGLKVYYLTNDGLNPILEVNNSEEPACLTALKIIDMDITRFNQVTAFKSEDQLYVMVQLRPSDVQRIMTEGQYRLTISKDVKTDKNDTGFNFLNRNLTKVNLLYSGGLTLAFAGFFKAADLYLQNKKKTFVEKYNIDAKVYKDCVDYRFENKNEKEK